MIEKILKEVSVDDLIPYENNPRINDDAVDVVVESIKQCEYISPIIVDENMVIMAGHTRLKALQKMKKKSCEVMIVNGLNETQKKKFRLLDNKAGEFSDWDLDLLMKELEDLDFGNLDIDWGLPIDEDETDEKYTMNTNIPQYEITGECPNFEDMLDRSNADALIEEIEGAEGISDAERSFLIEAAKRHNKFNYKNIAEYYAHASKEMQELMERSALVIIDIDNAIANGYVKLSKDLEEMISGD